VILDHIEAERFSPLGDAPLVAIDLAERGTEAAAYANTGAIVIGADRAGTLPPIDPHAFDCLITAAPDPPPPWTPTAHLTGWLEGVVKRIAAAPIAAATCLRVLRINQTLPPGDALEIESLAYSTLLGGDAYRRWRAVQPVVPVVPVRREEDPSVRVERKDDHVTITLALPASRNAMTAAMRDGLWEALAAVLDDPSAPTVTLIGDGACFSTGGHLPEFGSATDLAYAHAVRTARSCAGLLLELGDRAEAVLHGACIGSGIEIPAAAGRRRAAAAAFFQLPELAMGLMPGAGGTITLPRAIGRHRTAALVLSGRRLPLRLARSWGLVV
jgi:hypothetical protein